MFDGAIIARQALHEAQNLLDDMTVVAKLTLGDEWLYAKNNDVRHLLIERHYSESLPYAQAKDDYRQSKLALRIALLEIERVRLQVQAGGGA